MSRKTQTSSPRPTPRHSRTTLSASPSLDTVSTPIDAQLDRATDNIDWLLRVSMDIGDDSMLFASAATGTKSGGFNSVNGAAEDREFDDEETLTYELGIKATLLEQRVRVNATAFYTEIEEYQFQQQLESGIGTFVSNAAEIETSASTCRWRPCRYPT